MAEFETIRYESVEPHIVRIVLDRPDKRNAQNHMMTNELNRAFDRAAADDDVKVIILAAEGPHFCAGHDQITRGEPSEIDPVGVWHGYDLPGIEGPMDWHREEYIDSHWRWRNIPKPVIAAVHGKTIGGGLPLLWVCDIIVASEDASFADPAVMFGVNGVEYFGHPWEFGPRKAKELLFTADFLTAEEARGLGMVNQVVPRDELDETVLAMARKIATKPMLGLKLAKEAVNGMLEIQGQHSALLSAFALCTIGHAQMQIVGRLEFGDGPGQLDIKTGEVHPEVP